MQWFNHSILHSGFCEETPSKNSEPIVVLSDSQLPYGGDADGTLLPCSPSSLLSTNAALDTLKSQDEHDKQVEEEVMQQQAQV